jgi:hypothetical protein
VSNRLSIILDLGPNFRKFVDFYHDVLYLEMAQLSTLF